MWEQKSEFEKGLQMYSKTSNMHFVLESIDIFFKSLQLFLYKNSNSKKKRFKELFLTYDQIDERFTTFSVSYTI